MLYTGGLTIEFNLEELGWCLFDTVSHLLTWELRYSLKVGAIESGANFKVGIVRVAKDYIQNLPAKPVKKLFLCFCFFLLTKQSVNEQSGPVLSCHELVNQSVSWLLDYFYLLRYYLELRKRCIPNLLLMCVFFTGELR